MTTATIKKMNINIMLDVGKQMLLSKQLKFVIAKIVAIPKKIIKNIETINFKILPPKNSEISIMSKLEKCFNKFEIIWQKIKPKIAIYIIFTMVPSTT